MSYTITQLTAGPTFWGASSAMSSSGAVIANLADGYVYVSTDYGVTWTPRLNDQTRSLQGLAVSGNGQKIATVQDNSGVWISTDGGVNWSEYTVTGASTKNWKTARYTRDGSKLIIGGTYIYETTDNGANWTQINGNNYGVPYASLAISDDGNTVLASYYGAIGLYIGVYSGSWTWTNKLSGTDFSQVNGTNMSGDGTKMIASINSSTIRYSIDSGANWSTPTIPGLTQSSGAVVSQDGTRFTVLSNNDDYLYTATDPAGTWTGSPVGASVYFYNLIGNDTLSFLALGQGGGYAYVANFVVPPIICFREGTTITTFNPIAGREESTAVENVRPGMLVKTRTSGYVPVCIVGTSTVTIPNHAERTAERLYVCTKEQFPELTDDLYITGHHSILVNSLTDAEREETAADLGRVYVTEGKYRLPAHIDRRARVYEAPGAVERIWHFALDHNDEQMNYGVYANGLLVESCSIWRLRTMIGYTLIGANTAAIENSASYERVRGAETMMVGC